MELNPVFARRLYLCWLISSAEALNVPRLMTLTGWPRRTLQDVLKALPGLGVTLTLCSMVCVIMRVTTSWRVGGH